MVAPTCDVVVVGGRVAGAATALLLARAGLDVTVVERTRYGSDTLSTHALLRSGVLQLARWDVLPQVVAAGTPAVRSTTFHYRDADPTVIPVASGSAVDALYAPRRTLLDRVLVDAAIHAGVTVLHDRSVTELLTGGGRVTAVRCTTDRGRETTITARWVVGADGFASTVARAVSAPQERTGRAGSALLYRYLGECDVEGYEWAYGDAAAAGVIPTNDGLACTFVATTPQRMRALARAGREAAYDALLAQACAPLHERLRQARPASPLRGWAGRPGFLRRAWGPGWALVGDAGYFKDPISAHGMTDALRDAELLAAAVTAVFGGTASESSAFATYQERRDSLSTPLFDAVDEIAGYARDPHRVRRLLRVASDAAKQEVRALQELADHAWAGWASPADALVGSPR